MRLRVLQDHRTRIPDGTMVAMKEGEIVTVEDDLGAFLISDGQGIAFEIVDDDESPGEESGDKSDEEGPDRRAELEAMTKLALAALIVQKWVGLDGIGGRSTKAQFVDAIIAREGADARKDTPPVQTERPSTTEETTVVVGRDDDGQEIVAVLTVEITDGETMETLTLPGSWTLPDGSPLNDEQIDAVDIFCWPVDGLDGLKLGEDGEIIELAGGVADGRVAFVAGLVEPTLRKWLAEIDPEAQLDDLDREGLLEAIREL